MPTHAPTFQHPDVRLPRCPRCHDVQERDAYPAQLSDGRLVLACPTCGRQFRPTDSLSVFYELYDVLSMHRRGVHIDRMVSALLRYEQGLANSWDSPPTLTRRWF
jgi:uncharacterized C2H2 Zn-finger protein